MKKEKNNVKLYIEGCRRGDSFCQFQLFDIYVKKMYNTAIRFFNNKMIAEDIVQESFIIAFEKIESLNGNSSFEYWLKRIVINKCISRIRKSKIKFQEIDDNIVYSEDYVEDFDNYDLLYSAIHELPENAKVILNLYSFENYKHKEIAETLGITESTSRTQYKRAKELLAKIINKMILENKNEFNTKEKKIS